MRAYDGTEVPATLRLLANTLAEVERFLAESDCPLTPDQSAAFDGVRRHLDEQTEALA